MESSKISEIAQIASVLEVSGYPKPGNVHRNRDFHDMVFEDFLISGIAIGKTIKLLCEKSKKSRNDLSKINLGSYILKGVKKTNHWVKNNTNLGIIMMLMPIAASASISSNFNDLQENIDKIIKSTTVNDAINLYEAINLAEAGGMGASKEFDLSNDASKDELKNNNKSMYDVLEISSSWDTLASELTSKMPICFEISYPTFHKLKKENSLNNSTIITFLTILSNVPDTLISRKYNNKKAIEVSDECLKVLNSSPEDFIKNLKKFDDYLFENKLNPGTTADLTAASIMISYLKDEYEKE